MKLYYKYMEAVILCGGFAKRLLPISEFIPKPMLPLGGRPLLDHIIDRIVKLKLDKVYLSVNKKFQDQFKYYSSKRNDIEIDLIVEPTMREEEKLGAIKGLYFALEKIRNDDFLVVAGDNYFDFELLKIYDFYFNKKSITIGLYDLKDYEDAKRFGVVEIDEHNKIKSFEEKPKIPKSKLISTGIYIFPNNIKYKLSNYISYKNNPDQLGHFISWLIKNETVYGIPLIGKWYDIGTIDTYRELYNSFLP